MQYRRVTDSHPASHVAVASTRYAYLRHAVKSCPLSSWEWRTHMSYIELSVYSQIPPGQKPAPRLYALLSWERERERERENSDRVERTLHEPPSVLRRRWWRPGKSRRALGDTVSPPGSSWRADSARGSTTRCWPGRSRLDRDRSRRCRLVLDFELPKCTLDLHKRSLVQQRSV